MNRNPAIHPRRPAPTPRARFDYGSFFFELGAAIFVAGMVLLAYAWSGLIVWFADWWAAL